MTCTALKRLTWTDVVRQELGDMQRVLWELTGFPAFWNIPEDGETPEDCLRTRLREIAELRRTMQRCKDRGTHSDQHGECSECGVDSYTF